MRGKWGGGGGAWESISSSARWSSGLRDRGLQRRHRTAEQRKLREAQRKLTDGPCLSIGAMASGVRCAAALFATRHTLLELRAERTKTKPVRSPIHEGIQLQIFSEGKPHLERTMDGNFRCAASPDDRVIP
jgi:hypothetical protein